MQERYDDITAEREGIKSRLDAAQAERERIKYVSRSDPY